MSHLVISLIIFIAVILAFMLLNKRLTLATIAMTGMALMVLTGCLQPDSALACFSNSNAILMCSMFVVSAGFNRTQLVNKITAGICRVAKGSYYKVLVGYIILTVLMISFVPSMLVTFSIVLPLAVKVCKELKVSPAKMIFPIALAGIGSCFLIPTNMVIFYTAQINGFLETYGVTNVQMTVSDFMLCRAPGAILVLILSVFLVPKLTPDYPLADYMDDTDEAATRATTKLPPVREFIGYATFLIVLLGLIFTKVIGVSQWIVALTGAVVIACSGILKPKEVIESMNLSMVLLFVGSLGIGAALSETGVAELVGDKLSVMIMAVNNNYIAGAILWLVPFILTQFMSNNAVTAIFQPLYAMLAASMGINPIGIMMLGTMAPMASYLSPMASSAMPMIMSLGHYSQKDVLKMGLLPSLIVTVCVVVVSMTLYPLI